jgi:hypothetical protein
MTFLSNNICIIHLKLCMQIKDTIMCVVFENKDIYYLKTQKKGCVLL